MNRGRVYTNPALATLDFDSDVVDLTTSTHAQAQLSVLPNGDGFLIRVWPPNGVHEFGGSNLTTLSAVISFTDKGEPRLGSIDYYAPTALPEGKITKT